MAIYLGFLLLVTLSPILLAINMNRRKIRLLGLYAPVVFTLCMLKVIESNIRLPESGSLEASLLMFFLWIPFDNWIFNLYTDSIAFRLFGETLERDVDFSILYFRSSTCRCFELVCGIASSAPSVYIRSHYFDDSGFLSATSLSLLFRQRSVGPS